MRSVDQQEHVFEGYDGKKEIVTEGCDSFIDLMSLTEMNLQSSWSSKKHFNLKLTLGN